MLTLAVSSVQVILYDAKLTGSRARVFYPDFSVYKAAAVRASWRRLGAHLAPLLAAELWQRWMRISRRFLDKLEPRLLTAAAAILASWCLSRTGRGQLRPEFILSGSGPWVCPHRRRVSLTGCIQKSSIYILFSIEKNKVHLLK